MGLRCGWLSPDCVLHECPYSDHLPMSHELVVKYGIRPKARHDDDDALLAAGWFKLTRRLMLGNGGIFICWPRPYDDDTSVRLRLFLKGCITEKHREYFRKAYFNNPSDWDTDTVIDFIDYHIIEKDEIVDKNGIPEWMLN